MVNKQEHDTPENPQAAEAKTAEAALADAAGQDCAATEPELALEETMQPAADIDGLRAQLEVAQQEAAEARDQMMRAVAEAQNARRRAEKDVSSARLFALERFVQDLVPVIDNLERALESMPAEAGSASTVLEGVQLTLKSFLDVLARFNVEQLNPVGEPFDPKFHQAISMLESPDVEPGSVLNVVQKGYTLNGRLVRAAMVVVSR